jgi:hypothetical protein
MSRQALAAVLLQLPQLSERLRLPAAEGLELIADSAELVHLEQRQPGRPARVLTPPMSAERLLALIEGMALALDLIAS